MSKPPKDQLIAKLRQDLADIAAQARASDLTDHGKRKLNQELQLAVEHLTELLIELDPRKRPETIFDPGNPRTVAFFVALALTAQPKVPLETLGEFYGSGVYALYYKGDYPLYASYA